MREEAADSREPANPGAGKKSFGSGTGELGRVCGNSGSYQLS